MDKSTDIKELVRPNIRALNPYKSARSSYEQGILMDANELPQAPHLNIDLPIDLDLNRYPSPNQLPLRNLISRFRDIPVDHIFTGVGSDEAIDLLLRIFCRPAQDEILVTPPTYGMYKVGANIHDITIREAPLSEDFQLQSEEVIKAITQQTKIIFLCSPNNPTGNILDPIEIEKILAAAPGLVIIDEAYIDFAQSVSWSSRLTEFDNLVVLQTMSKSFGLAGIRLGWALAHPTVIDFMMRVKAPYNINKLTSAAAISAFQHLDNWQKVIHTIQTRRDQLTEALKGVPTVAKVYPSEANFVLFKIDNAKEVYEQLVERDIIIRYRGNLLHCDNCLRASVGTKEQNNQLIAALHDITS